MFGNKKTTMTNSDYESEKLVTLIGAGAICDGNFTAKDSTRIDGTINGSVNVSGCLIIGQTGKIKGNVKAQNVFLAGEIIGNSITTDGKIEISDTGRILGDIMTKSMIMDENSIFSGNCTMTGQNASAITAKERAIDAESSNNTSSEDDSNDVE